MFVLKNVFDWKRVPIQKGPHPNNNIFLPTQNVPHVPQQTEIAIKNISDSLQ